MTTNQIEFAKMTEQGRHNLATEAETNRNNVVVSTETNRHNLATEGEANRSNLAKENQLRNELKESKRHNKAGEKENRRHNKVGEQQGYMTIAETNRHNVATETEANRSNLAKEANDRYATDVGYQSSVDSASINAASRVAAANISAEASKYATDVGNINTRLHEMAENSRNADRNATTKQVAEMQDATKRAEGYAERLQNAILSGDQNNVNRQKNAIDRFRAQIDAKYKKGDLSLRQANTLKDILRDLSKTSNEAAGTLMKKGR